MKKILFILIPVLIYCGCASTAKRGVVDEAKKEKTAVVDAEGMVAIKDDDILDAKKRALADAQKNAVEMAVGVYVNAVTLVEKAKLVEQQILSKTNGYIKKYKILSEGREDNFYKTKIQAVVKIEEINKDLTDVGLNIPLRSSAYNLKIAVVILDKIDGKESNEDISENILIEELIKQNYKIIDKNTVKKATKTIDKNYLVDDLDNQKRLGESIEADIIISGNSSASLFKEKTPRGNILSYGANISFKVIKVKQAAILYSNSFTGGGRGITEELAATNALRRAALSASDDLSSVLRQRLKDFNYITIFANNIKTINQLNLLVKGLQKRSEVKNTKIVSYSDSRANIKVETDPENISSIAKDIVSMVKDINIKVRSISSDSIEIEIR